MVIIQHSIDLRCGVDHNHHLQLFDFVIKAFPSFHSSVIMQEQQKERWKELCELAAQEQNPKRLIELVAEINRLLEQREQRLIAARKR